MMAGTGRAQIGIEEGNMRRTSFVLALMVGSLLTAAAVAQQPAAAPAAQNPAAAMKLFASSADVAGLVAKAKSDRKVDQPMLVQRVVGLAPPYTVNLEYRPGVGPASVHEREAELFYVLEGTATAVTGGKLVNERRTNPENLSGTAIDGGTSQHMSKGDFLLVPAGVPHWFKDTSEYFQFSLHLPVAAR
jgi:mannose-6-phosphate isomerase-like protein (cupin superfamily)